MKCITLCHKPVQWTSSHFCETHSITVWWNTLYHSVQYTIPQWGTIHYITIWYNTLYNSVLQISPSPNGVIHYIKVWYTSPDDWLVHCTPSPEVHFDILHCGEIDSITVWYNTKHHNFLKYKRSHYIIVQWNTLHQ